MNYCSINGQEKTELSIIDRGLSYGDGIFTTAKISNGKVVLLDQHIDRLVSGCNRLQVAKLNSKDLYQQLSNVAKAYEKATLKVIITAGSGGRGYSRVGLSQDAYNTIIMVSDFPHYYDKLSTQGITLGNSQHKLGSNPMISGIKHLNRLEQVLLRAELDQRCEDDLIVMNENEQVVEATSSNVFYWLDNCLCTPKLTTSGVNGLIRQAIIAHNPETKIRTTTLSDLSVAQGLFICNSLMGIMPVKTYNNRQLSINTSLALKSKMEGYI